MATKDIKYFEMQDHEGAVFYPHSSSNVIFMDSGRTVEEDMPEMVKNPVKDVNGDVGDILPSHLTIGNRDESQVIGAKSMTIGSENGAYGDSSFASGYGCLADDINSVFGKYNKSLTPSNPGQMTGDLFAIGCGISKSIRSNAFRADAAGKCYSKSTISSSGADFAEYFEWKDGNKNGEDRRGLFVTLDGDKLVLANSHDEYIIGVIAAVPTVAGNAYSDEWQGQYLTDVFGEPITKNGAFIVNPKYDPSQEYIPREKRNEWGLVGMLGQLIICDDGSCQINGYCYPGTNGVATSSEKGYRVISRIDERHIKVIIK